MAARGFFVFAPPAGLQPFGVRPCACAKGAGSPIGDPLGSAPGRRRERPAKRAALIPYRKFSHRCYSPQSAQLVTDYPADRIRNRIRVAEQEYG